MGWQHGRTPAAPTDLLPESTAAWRTWMGPWVAAHWAPGDLPALHILIGLYDVVARGDAVRAGELRLWMDGYGLTPKGRQDRRWRPPQPVDERPSATRPDNDPYRRLRALADSDGAA